MFYQMDIKKLLNDYFQQDSIQLSWNSNSQFYPGYCEQCYMNNGGIVTNCIPLLPNCQIIICNECEIFLKEKINQCIEKLQKNTFFELLDKELEYNISNQELKWKIDKRFRFFIHYHKNVYIPMIKENHLKFVLLRHLIILNDIKIK
jgi:hypothetical protein